MVICSCVMFLYAVMIMLYMYHTDLLILWMRYTPWTIIIYIGLLWFGLADMIYLVEEISKMTIKMVDYNFWDSPYGLYEQYGVGNYFDLKDTLRSLKEKIRSYKADNDIIIQEQEKQAEVNAVILQSLSYLQRHGPRQISHEQEDRTNGAYGSRSHSC